MVVAARWFYLKPIKCATEVQLDRGKIIRLIFFSLFLSLSFSFHLVLERTRNCSIFRFEFLLSKRLLCRTIVDGRSKWSARGMETGTIEMNSVINWKYIHSMNACSYTPTQRMCELSWADSVYGHTLFIMCVICLCISFIHHIHSHSLLIYLRGNSYVKFKITLWRHCSRLFSATLCRWLSSFTSASVENADDRNAIMKYEYAKYWESIESQKSTVERYQI